MQTVVEQAVTETVTYLSEKYGFAEEEAQAEVKKMVLPKYQEKKIGRPEKQKKEHASSPRDKAEEEANTFLAEVDRHGDSKVEYKKIVTKKGKSKIDTPVNSVSVVQVAALVAEVVEEKSTAEVDAKIAEVMRAQAEKFKEMMMTKKETVPKVAKETVPKVAKVPTKVLPKEEVPKVVEVASNVDVDAKIAEVMRAQAEKYKIAMMAPSSDPKVAEEKKKVMKKKPVVKASVEEIKSESVVDMKTVEEKIAEVMRAQSQALQSKVQTPAVVSGPVAKKEKKEKLSADGRKTRVVETALGALYVPIVDAKTEAQIQEHIAKSNEKSAAQNAMAEIEDEDLMAMMEEYEKSREVVEIPEDQMFLMPKPGEESMTMFRHEGTLYKKSKSGLLYDRYKSEVCLGKVDENGKVTLMAQQVEDELCSEEESGSEDELEYDSEEE